MRLVMGFGAIIFAILNLVWTSKQKNSKWFGFISLSLTALTACSFYSDAAVQVTAVSTHQTSWIVRRRRNHSQHIARFDDFAFDQNVDFIDPDAFQKSAVVRNQHKRTVLFLSSSVFAPSYML